ncbi:MAG TPA: hypothetical protein DEP35_10465 [Deltaproteobacteria bacterium]|jgi:hypothetical protein|nr:hypothetical protein [Deltaproteobacteria bacterium]
MRKKARNIEGVPLLTWLRRALPEIAASGLGDRHAGLLKDPTLSRALKGSLRKLRAELENQDPRDEAQLRAVDTIAAELGLRSFRGRRLVKDRFGGGSAVHTARPARTQSQATPQDVGADPLDAVLSAIASVPLRTAWEWFRQGMQLAHTLSSPERGRAATAAGRSLARDTAAALARFKRQGSSKWTLEARVVADLESRLAALALRDMRESSDPLTPRDVGQAVLEAIASRAEPQLEGSELVRAGSGERLQMLRPIADEKCPRCGHDPERCFGAFADEDA